MTSVTIHGIRFTNVHEPHECDGRHCIVHNPLPTHMDTWPVTYRENGVWERKCPHGIGHPDPSQFDFWAVTDRMDLAVHGCDGCCHPDKNYRRP